MVVMDVWAALKLVVGPPPRGLGSEGGVHSLGTVMARWTQLLGIGYNRSQNLSLQS